MHTVVLLVVQKARNKCTQRMFDNGIFLDYMATVSAVSAVGWVVSPIIRRMVSLVQSYMSSQYNWKSGILSDLKNLEATLMDILLVVGAAERQHVVDINQMLLLQQMKDAVSDAEDVLDEFDYMLLKEKVEPKGLLRRIGSSSLSVGMRLVNIDKFSSNLRKVLKSLERVRASAEMFVRVMALEGFNPIQSLECVPARITGSLLHEDAIFGREKEIDELVGQLLYISDKSLLSIHQKLRTEVHTIVGVGGIGKTTLAQLIYNDDRIVDSFDVRMWVSVSNNFDKTRITKEIIAYTTGGENAELANFNFSKLQEELRWRLRCKRFLLVLDDVWYDEKYGEHINKERWMDIIAPIKEMFTRPGSMTGSKILVTTRTELVAKMLDSRSLFILEGLGRDDSWSLFRRCAFGSRKPEGYPELKQLGYQIVQKLKGSPLALKVVGGHLNGKYSDAEWEDVLQKDVLNPNDILTILHLSYESLPEHLQQCFAYCSLFSKGYRIDSKRLIRMWIAQGLVHLEGNNSRSLEDIGRGYFNDLLARSFFQVLRCGDQTYYVMHDSLNDLALHVSNGECFRVDHGSVGEFPHYIRHLSVSAEQLGDLVNYDGLRRLRTFMILNDSWFCSKVCLSHDILNKLKSVRVLDVSGCCFGSFPEAVNDLIHLRYLAIQRTYYPLPTTISRLNHLQSLFVLYHSCYSARISCSNKRKQLKYLRREVNTTGGHFRLPESISRLINLVHVDVEKAYTLMLSGVFQLPCVEGSGEFLVNKKEQSLVQLKDLNKIRGELSVKFLENVKNREEAAKSHLDLKEHISKLELEWGSCDGAHDMDKGFEVLDVLKPHRNLDELTISGYPGVKSPSWLESDWLRRLKLICLRDCNRWEVLPPLGDLPLLRTLEVRRMEELKALGQEFFGHAGFPSLERLLLERLPKLEWCLVDNDKVLQNLRHLSVAGCPRLRSYPTHPRTLRHIAVLDQERIQVKAQMDSLDLSRSFCRLVSSSLHVLHAHHLECIEDMDIYVNHSVDTSTTVFSNLKSLKQLQICGINRANTPSVITTLWGENGATVLPSSLRFLELRRCYLQPSSFSKLLKNLPSLVTLHLIECDTVEIPGLPVSLHLLRMLKQLYIYKCDWISSFEGSEALLSLEEMKIDQCYDLEYVPYLDDMPCLQKLHLSRCPQVMRLSKAVHQTTLKELVVRSCDGLSSLRKLCDLVSLVKLTITDCSDLLWLPDMTGFYSLRVLSIDRCPRLRSLPRSGLPVSLETFFLSRCHQALEEQFQRKEGPDWNKFAALPGCKWEAGRR
uniref:NB-ARC domain-containing protein n=1 Tax=Hordeum vulgare subsp. vulgare TaxID=112509 RepID=A0A287XDC9_HORVV